MSFSRLEPYPFSPLENFAKIQGLFWDMAQYLPSEALLSLAKTSRVFRTALDLQSESHKKHLTHKIIYEELTHSLSKCEESDLAELFKLNPSLALYLILFLNKGSSIASFLKTHSNSEFKSLFNLVRHLEYEKLAPPLIISPILDNYSNDSITYVLGTPYEPTSPLPLQVMQKIGRAKFFPEEKNQHIEFILSLKEFQNSTKFNFWRIKIILWQLGFWIPDGSARKELLSFYEANKMQCCKSSVMYFAALLACTEPQKAAEIFLSFSPLFITSIDLQPLALLLQNIPATEHQVVSALFERASLLVRDGRDAFRRSQDIPIPDFIEKIAPIYPEKAAELVRLLLEDSHHDINEDIRGILLLASIQPETLIPKLSSYLDCPSQEFKDYFILLDKHDSLFKNPQLIIHMLRRFSSHFTPKVTLFLLLKTVDAVADPVLKKQTQNALQAYFAEKSKN